jgi:hypothetical protein
VHPYIGMLWTLNDCGALPKTLEDALNAKHGDIDPFLENLLHEPTISVENIQQFEFHKHDLPAIYTELICVYLKSKLSNSMKYGLIFHPRLVFRSCFQIDRNFLRRIPAVGLAFRYFDHNKLYLVLQRFRSPFSHQQATSYAHKKVFDLESQIRTIFPE